MKVHTEQNGIKNKQQNANPSELFVALVIDDVRDIFWDILLKSYRFALRRAHSHTHISLHHAIRRLLQCNHLL